jgi:DinB superfamily
MDSHLKRLQEALREATEGMSAEERSWHPPGKWCVDEVLEHLYLTYTGTIRGFTRALEAGKPSAGRVTPGQRARILLVVGLGYMPEGRSAPAGVVPRGLAGGTVNEEIGGKIAEMDAVIGRCERELGGGKFRGRAILEHPILGPLTARQWRKFHLVHGMHHAKQIRRLREEQGSGGRD